MYSLIHVTHSSLQDSAATLTTRTRLLIGRDQGAPKARLKALAELGVHAVAGIADRRPGFPRREQVHYMHFSPPCQGISRVNTHKTLLKYQTDLVPLFKQVQGGIAACDVWLQLGFRYPGFLTGKAMAVMCSNGWAGNA